ncbi:MAG: hypothetical protein AAGA48_09395 [Myxococcota bacterium]
MASTPLLHTVNRLIFVDQTSVTPEVLARVLTSPHRARLDHLTTFVGHDGSLFRALSGETLPALRSLHLRFEYPTEFDDLLDSLAG